MAVKRALIPYVPDRVLTRYRYDRERIRWRLGIASERALSRTNVDVLVAPSEARRWLLSTVDTYRIVEATALPDVGEPGVTIPEGVRLEVSSRLLGWHGNAAVVVGYTREPRWGDRRAGNAIEPLAVHVVPSALEEVGGVPAGDEPLRGLVARLVDAGHPIALVPSPRSSIDDRRHDAIGGTPVVVLAAVPMHDVGGGSRGTQIAIELANRGYQVNYVNRYPSYEEVDLGIRFIHPGLEQVTFDEFDISHYLDRTERSGVVLVELPHPSFAPVLTALRAAGWRIIYDLIDDWTDVALGGKWYDQDFERQLARDADAVVGSAPDLVERASGFGRAGASLVPNAVNGSIFGAASGMRPADLPDGHIIGYHGSLYGNWIDWGGIRRVASAFPASTIAMIGEPRHVPDDLPHNVRFLGLKPQSALPGYLQRFDVAFVPFEISDTTHAVSPLKVYEYLASGVPVAAPPLRTLDGLDGVYTDSDIVEAVRAAADAPRPDRQSALEDHAWGSRVRDLLATVGITADDEQMPRVRIVERPVTHIRRQDRHLR